ncbi:Phage capsid and scaffold [Mucinivorans hirudinis]|uniref:Phage capsid and scaffold n=1 Tax=Mucinivorans hirudinis TaxID=1433126 RepID=A0A060R6K6_9BACT|nr:Phage capsid and scaffold [Mucinivorans hirudinis]
MSGVRIKDLQSAKPLIEGYFDEMEFVVDLPQPDATIKMSGAELKEAVGIKKHIHPLEEVDGLPGELEKKFDKAGGMITGNLRVLGDGRMKNLRVDEYLEVPELKYNRITATGNEFWVTDAGVVDDAWEDDDDMYVVELKSKEGEVTINFQYKDILRGIFYTTDEDGNPTGFKTAYFEVTGIISETMFHCYLLNGITPQRFMTLARQGNKTNPARQGSIYLDGLHKFIRIIDKVTDDKIEQKNIKVQLGDLSEINHPVFGQLSGYGALLENAYICGRLVQRNPDTGEDWIVGAVAVQGEQVFRYNSDGICEPVTITLTAVEFGITSPETARTWQYKDGSLWVDIPNTQSLIFELSPNSEIWRERRTLTLRYLACGVYYDIITITKVYDGEDAYSVRILSTNGTNFINGDIGTFLQAAIFKGSRDITATLPDNAFNWFRVSDNPDGDIVWNELHQGAGSRIWIADPDVYRRATFECEIII